MDKQVIFYYATNQELPNYLNPFLQSEDYELKAYQIGDAIDSSIFLLFSPVWINNHFIACDQSWKNYLQIENPPVKLISVGTVEAVHSNYIDILNLPNRFNHFFDNAKPAADSWTPVYTGGVKMEAKLQRFFEGHGNDSVSQIFSSINRDIKIINRALSAGDTLSVIKAEYTGFHTFIENWRIFKNRFSNYFPFLKCVPFFLLFKKIYKLTGDIDGFFQQGCTDDHLFQELKIFEQIFEIHSLLNKGAKYVQ